MTTPHATDSPTAKTPPRRPRRRRLARSALWGLTGGLGLCFLIWLFLLTPLGLRTAARLAESGIEAGSGLTARIEDVSGVLPFSLRLGRLALADKHGPWLLVQNAHFSWSPLALLRGRVLIRDLGAGLIRVRRAPDVPAAPTEQTPIEWPPRFPSLPPILIDRLSVERLMLDKELVGQDAAIAIEGRLAESGRGAVALTLDAKRLDTDKPLSLRLTGALNYAAWRLSAKLELADAPGGLLASALAGPDGGAVSLRLDGDGPLDAWKGRLVAALAGAPVLNADLGLAVPLTPGAMATVSLDATASPRPGLLPQALGDLLGQAPRLTLTGRAGIVSGALSLDAATVTTAAGTLTAKADLDPAKDTLAATVRITVPEAARLAPSLAGALETAIEASGSVTRPKLTAKVTATSLAAAGVRLETADITATAEPTGRLENTFPGANLTLAGHIRGLAGPEGTTLLGQALNLAATAAVDAKGAVTAPEISLTGQGGSVVVGPVRYAAGETSAKLALAIKDIAGAASLAGLRLTGAFSAKADGGLDATGSGRASLTADVSALGAGSKDDQAASAITALLGASPHLATKLIFGPAGGELSELTLEGKSLHLRGGGQYKTAGEVAAKLQLAIPDLAVLAGSLGKPCSGGLKLDVTAAGPAASPKIEAKLNLDRPVYDSLALAGVDLTATVADPAGKPTGTLTLTARRDKETARLETGFALAGDVLTVKNLRLSAPEASFSGEATVQTATGLASGSLSGQAADLAGIGRFAGLALGGSLRLNATAKATGKAQGVRCDLAASGLRLPGLVAGKLDVKADLDDITGQVRGQANVSGANVEAGGLNLSSLTLAARPAGRGATTIDMETKGTIPGDKKLTLSTRAALAQSGRDRLGLTVERLTGSLAKHAFALNAPARLAFGGGTIRLDALALTFDAAKITASADLGPKAVTGKLAVGSLPLALLAEFGLPAVSGTANLDAALSGSRARPSLKADARLDGLHLASEKGAGLPPSTLAATLELAGGQCQLKARLSGTDKKNLTEGVFVTAALPVRFALEPFALDVPPGGHLSGTITADNDLKDLATFLAQANTRMSGRLRANLALGGTLGAPSLTGGLDLDASRLENADSGIVLQKLAIHLEAAEGLVRITKGGGQDTKGGGQDTKGGSFSLTGQIALGDLQNGPVETHLRLTNLQVAGLDLARVTASGNLDVTGTLSHMRAAGHIELGPAEINLPTSLPPSVTVIPVTYVNDPKAPKTPKQAAPPAVARRIDLDLTVALGRSVYVRGLGLESRWGGQIAITGTAAAPVIVGKYSVEKGTVDLFGTNLEIAKGEVAFKGESPPLPTLDILAQNTVNDVTAGVTITGEAASPTIGLTSNPTLPRDEILSRILFGQSATTLAPLQAAQLAQAAASLYAGGTPTSLLARTRRILGLDQLSVTSTDSTMASSVMRAGKEIVKGVTVNVEQGLTAQSGAVSVEVDLGHSVTVESRAGQDNKQGVGVNWKLDY